MGDRKHILDLGQRINITLKMEDSDYDSELPH